MSMIAIDSCSANDVEIAASPRPAVAAVEPVRQRYAPDGGVRVGELVAIRDGVVPYVVFPGQSGTAAIPARSVATLATRDVGAKVVLSFADGDLAQPIVMGRLVEDRASCLGSARPEIEVDADGQTLVVTARDEIVLRCGKASITLTRAGKILIRGTYVSSRSLGVNRIKGGTVEIN
jgi:hypothetical protein